MVFEETLGFLDTPPPFRVLFAKLGKIYYLKGEIDELLREKYNKKE